MNICEVLAIKNNWNFCVPNFIVREGSDIILIIIYARAERKQRKFYKLKGQIQ